MYNIDIYPTSRLQSTLYQINLDKSIFSKASPLVSTSYHMQHFRAASQFRSGPTLPWMKYSVRKHAKQKSLKNQNTVKHLFMQTTRDDENSSSIAIPIAYSLCPSNFHWYRQGTPYFEDKAIQCCPTAYHEAKTKEPWVMCHHSAWHISYLTYPLPSSSSLYLSICSSFTFLYKDQQVVPRHRGKLRCTLAARRASPLQSVPNKSCEWNAGIPIKLKAKGTENQWVGKWICVRGPADSQRLCWLPSSLKHAHIYIYTK